MADQRRALGRRSVVVADTSVTSSNVGDQIIMDAVWVELAPLLAGRRTFTVATHSPLGMRGRELLEDASLAIVGGTNLLASTIDPRQLWRIVPLAERHRKFVLAGVGLGRFDRTRPSRGARALLRSVLHPDAPHSARDRHTAAFLSDAGFDARYTGCLTTWSLGGVGDLVARPVPHRRAVLVLNHDLGSRAVDTAIVEAARSVYDELHFWPQNARDDAYGELLGPDVALIPGSLAAYRAFLQAHHADLDVVGTRIHGSVFAMRHGARATLFALDDRTRAMGADVDLPVFDVPASVDEARAALAAEARPTPRPATAAIDQWMVDMASHLDRDDVRR